MAADGGSEYGSNIVVGPMRSFARPEQTFPTLTDAEIARMRHFGELKSYSDGELMFETGKPGRGMFVMLSGHVAITERDGLGHVTPIVEQGPRQFVAEVGQLSGRVSLVDGHAEGDVETLLIPPDKLRALLVAEADLGERIMRALILRRVSLFQGGVGGPVLIGPPNSASVAGLQNFLEPQQLSASSARSRARSTTPPRSSRAIRLRPRTGRWWSPSTAPCCAIPVRTNWRVRSV